MHSLPLKKGKCFIYPNYRLDFILPKKTFLKPQVLGSGSKNISYNPMSGKVKGSNFQDDQGVMRLTTLMARFAKDSRQLLDRLIPSYKTALMTGRTSFRPAEIQGRKTSILKDDTRLHVDAFPATPNQGKRILRVFTNVNPLGQSRHWHLGEPFEKVLLQFLPKLQKPFFGTRKLLSALKITKSYRTLYDHYMLMLHNQMKLSDQYQKKVEKTEVHFLPGATWIAMTDSVSHAALSGQFMLEQTFYLPVSAMQQPAQSPLLILEQALGKRLIHP